MISEQEQLEAWFESLSDEQRAAVLAADLNDIPGWIIASIVDAHARIHEDPDTDDAKDFKYRVPQALKEFVERHRGDA